MGKLNRFAAILIFAFGSLLMPRFAHAYAGSERDEMREDVREALSRARDFHSQQVREALEEAERQKGISEVKKARSEFESEQEKSRESFVRERNERPNETLAQVREERSFDEEKIIAEREMDKSRQHYVKDRRQVQRIINRRAHIDEAQEYGL